MAEEQKSTGFGLKMITAGSKNTGLSYTDTGSELAEMPKRKRGRPKKKTDEDGNEVIEVVTKDPVPMAQSTKPYHDTYQETDNMLRKSIAQLDVVTADMYEDLKEIRSSKTMRKKYDYITGINQTIVSAINGRVQAAKELNNSIKNSHELDLKRAKELKLNEQQDDTKDIMNLYQAFVSQPVSQNMTGPFTSPLGASTQDLTLAYANPNVQMSYMGQDPDSIYDAYRNNMTPSQVTMMIEDNPNIKHVIAYDPSTGGAEFAVYDSSSGQFLQGVPTRNREMYMDGMHFDFNNMQAHSNDLNETYDIIYVNTPQPQDVKDNITTTGKDMSNY